MPSYPEIRLALPGPGDVERRLERVRPDAIHIATEGPLGHAVRRVCMRRGLPFTTSLHTRFPDYLADRLPVAGALDLRRHLGLAAAVSWRRRGGAGGDADARRRAGHARLQQRQAVAARRRCATCSSRAARDARICRGRFFLRSGGWRSKKISRPFSSSICPAPSWWSATGRRALRWRRPIPRRCFSARAQGEALAEIYAAADVFVFPSRTDTFGLVLLEALASGVPVAAFPAAAPRDVIGEAPVGALDEDLRRACLAALECSREDCRDFALSMSWEASARIFLEHVANATNNPMPEPLKRRLLPQLPRFRRQRKDAA